MASQTTDSQMTCPRLIEVALPIREISAESIRDKFIPSSHIRHLHIWWARRPLAASRAVVFASLVPDPDDPRCPEEFRQAVQRSLKTHVPPDLKYYMRGKTMVRSEDPYCPYEGIPDTLRNRLLAFIAKWSPESLAFETGKRKKAPVPKELLDNRSLVKWETSDPDNGQGQQVLRIARDLVSTAHDGRTPIVLDPFAGGGAIPLEAGRLGCQAIANDYNPVAYLILRATCELPQKYGKPGTRKVILEQFGKKVERAITVTNTLVHDFENWANWILDRTKEKIAHLYLAGKDGRPVLGYLWVRTAPCSNPSCRGEIPLIRSPVLCSKEDKRIGLTVDAEKSTKKIRFDIVRGENVRELRGTMVTGGARCPFCEQTTPTEEFKQASFNGQLAERIATVIIDAPGGKEYRPVEQADLDALEKARELLDPALLPSESMPNSPDLVSGRGWNFKTWSSLFNMRQLVAMQTFVTFSHEAMKLLRRDFVEDDSYKDALAVYLGLWIDKIASFQNSVCIWETSLERPKNPFGRQALPFSSDYPECNPFSGITGSASTQLRYMMAVIAREQPAKGQLYAQVYGTDAASLPDGLMQCDYVITDPPYFDAISYGDLSDFFYVWLKRCLSEYMPATFRTPLSPKADEATAIKYRHQGDEDEADRHFTRKLSEALCEAHRLLKPNGVTAVMFAHQSTKAWSALVQCLFKAGLSIEATWPIDTESTAGLKTSLASLSSSITVVCRPRTVGSAASFREVRNEIVEVVKKSVKRFWSFGFRGADLIVACYGPAVGVFGKYERVEKADGTPVGVPELLELSKQAARDAIAGEFRGDNLSMLYYVWANLYGASEQAWDDARMIAQIGGDHDDAMEVARGRGVFVVEGAECRLALLADRADRRGLGNDPNSPLIDALHRSMLLWKEEKRSELVNYLVQRDLLEDGPFWKLAQALFEVLPRDTEDWKLTNSLLGERETLRAEAKRGKSGEREAGLFDS